MPKGVYERKPYMRTVKVPKSWDELLLYNYEKLKDTTLHINSPHSGGGVTKMATLFGVHPDTIYRRIKRARRRYVVATA